MSERVRVTIDSMAINSEIQKRKAKAQAALDAQVMKDSNYFVPIDTHVLETSVITGSVIGSSVLEWDTPYARKQYYEYPNKSKDENPNAVMKWFEAAKAKYKDVWIRIANNVYHS